MKKVLLASTALAGASLLAASASAGTPIVSDNQEVSISGNLRFSLHTASQDVRNAGATNKGEGRGYKFVSDESEIKFSAQAAADNGLEFGLQIEIQTQTNDTDNSDETWLFLQYEGAGRIELGDQDGAADRVFVDASDAMAGRGGFNGPISTLFNFGNAARTGPGTNVTGDATKATYFTPRFGGFQAGFSWVPDVAQTGGAGQADDNGTYENVISLGANFQQSFNNVSITVAASGEFGEDDNNSQEDLEIWGIGALASFAGFKIGAGYTDFNDTGVATGTVGDGGEWWDIGASYATGPWTVGAGAFFSEQTQATGDVEVDIYSLGVSYAIAPGLALASDLNFVDVDDIPTATDNEGYTFVLSLTASF